MICFKKIFRNCDEVQLKEKMKRCDSGSVCDGAAVYSVRLDSTKMLMCEVVNSFHRNAGVITSSMPHASATIDTVGLLATYALTAPVIPRVCGGLSGLDKKVNV